MTGKLSRPSDETGDMRRSERRAVIGVGVRLSPWLLRILIFGFRIY